MSNVSNFLSGRPRSVQKKSSPPTYYVKLCVIRQWILCSSHRQELLADILHRRSDVLELFSGFIDFGKSRIRGRRLVL